MHHSRPKRAAILTSCAPRESELHKACTASLRTVGAAHYAGDPCHCDISVAGPQPTPHCSRRLSPPGESPKPRVEAVWWGMRVLSGHRMGKAWPWPTQLASSPQGRALESDDTGDAWRPHPDAASSLSRSTPLTTMARCGDLHPVVSPTDFDPTPTGARWGSPGRGLDWVGEVVMDRLPRAARAGCGVTI